MKTGNNNELKKRQRKRKNYFIGTEDEMIIDGKKFVNGVWIEMKEEEKSDDK